MPVMSSSCNNNDNDNNNGNNNDNNFIQVSDVFSTVVLIRGHCKCITTCKYSKQGVFNF